MNDATVAVCCIAFFAFFILGMAFLAEHADAISNILNAIADRIRGRKP